jgi:hypothetical protein
LVSKGVCGLRRRYDEGKTKQPTVAVVNTPCGLLTTDVWVKMMNRRPDLSLPSRLAPTQGTMSIHIATYE